MELLNILAQYRVIRDALKAKKYIAAWRGLIAVQEAMCTLAESVGFQATAEESKARAEIQTIAAECCELAETASATHEAAVGAFDWRSLVVKLLQALFEAWKP